MYSSKIVNYLYLIIYIYICQIVCLFCFDLNWRLLETISLVLIPVVRCQQSFRSNRARRRVSHSCRIATAEQFAGMVISSCRSFVVYRLWRILLLKVNKVQSCFSRKSFTLIPLRYTQYYYKSSTTRIDTNYEDRELYGFIYNDGTRK